MNRKQTIQVKDSAKLCNNVLEKLGWKWEPKVGEWFFHPLNGLCLIWQYGNEEGDYIKYHNYGGIDNTIHTNCSEFYAWGEGREYIGSDEFSKFIPILHWQEIERVLERVGYYLRIGKKKSAICAILKDGKNLGVSYWGPTKQEVVRNAVIALGKKLGDNLA